MGIPKFFRWLTRRYPMILQTVQALEDVPPVDYLYLDLNGIVHNAIHGNDPKRHERISKLDDLEELWASIMRSIDEIVHIVKPKKMLFLAVDGVAPRAKMNQQRARRFKSAKERELLTNSLRAQGKNIPEMFDTNAISPGTEFMINLCEQLHFFIKYKINTDPLYRDLNECIISDGNVPGEGEHKMLDYVRQARIRPDYSPNIRHCYYGADADLIMLSLLTHEPHFTIIREEHIIKKQKNGGVQRVELSMTNNFQLLHISLLREYFQLEYRYLVGKLKMKWDLERIIDDFIFFCFFIGNDFLPSISALDIAEGSLDQLIEFYKNILPNMDDYITHQGVINWSRAEQFIWILGEHEHEVFKDRIDSIGRREREETRTISVTNESNPLMAEQGRGNRTLQTFNMFKEQIYQKKVQKVAKLKAKNETLKYKKHLITKKFKEDAENKSKMKKQEKEDLTAKFQQLYLKSKTEESKVETSFEGRSMFEVVQEIDQECFSDLQPEDIPDDCVSDFNENVNEQTLESLETAQKSQHDSITNAAAEMVKNAEEANLRFMTKFIKLYSQDPQAAKAMYYNAKVQIDISTDEGKIARKKMMKKYLEGIQWVLFYYYRGAQHWRWYYPYHYAPHISDLGYNIVKDFLGGNSFISKFETDFNCPLESHPYTPFQQLLSIMPIRSFKLLPSCYKSIATGELNGFFPDDFSVDLNGKTLAWEAIVLIPFCDQKLFLEAEQRMIASGKAHYTDREKNRNQWTFSYVSYKYAPNQPPKTLRSTLTGLKSLDYDNTSSTVVEEYSGVGENTFISVILPKCQLPCPGYPSFKQLNIIDIEYETILVRKVQFKKLLVKIPQCIEETQPEKLEEYLWKLAKQANKEVYIDLPYHREAFPMFFEDAFSIYTLYGDVNSNHFTIQHAAQWRSPNEWEGMMKRMRFKLGERGIFCPAETTNVLVTCNKVQNVLYQSEFDSHYFYKTYDEQPDMLPLSLIVRRRDPSHFLNVDARVRSLEGDLNPKMPCISLKMNLFGLMGQIDFIDMRKQLLKISFDKKAEEAKVHDPFMGQKHLQYLQTTKKDEVEKAQSYFGEEDIDKMLGFKSGVTARITSSFMLVYKDDETKERNMVDIGLNMKSWQKQMHVAGYVRFTQSADNAAINQFDGYEHNQFAHGAKHIRAHWEYSLATVEIIKEFCAKFPVAISFISKSLKKNAGMPNLKEMYGSNNHGSIQKLKEILKWIESLPVSHLPFVDMGFDALTPEMVTSLNNHREIVQKNFQPCNLLAKEVDWTKPHQVFVERFPYWASPFPDAKIQDFQVGTRVININSTKREYIPFGLRGTVIGKTAKHVMVLFDEQFLQGTDINGHCEMYRGAIVDPTNLINLTKKFTKQLQNNADIVSKFTEVDPKNPNQALPTYQPEPGHTQDGSNDSQAFQETSQNQGNQRQGKQSQGKQTNHGLMASQKQANQSKQKAFTAPPQKTTIYQPKQTQEAAQFFMDDPAISQPKQTQPDPAISQPKKTLSDPAISQTKQQIWQPKQTQAKIADQEVSIPEKSFKHVDPAIASVVLKVENAEELPFGLPKIQFAPIKANLQPSAEFQQLMAEMKMPSTAQDLLAVCGSATGPSASSSTSQAMLSATSVPLVAPTNAPKDGDDSK